MVDLLNQNCSQNSSVGKNLRKSNIYVPNSQENRTPLCDFLRLFHTLESAGCFSEQHTSVPLEGSTPNPGNLWFVNACIFCWWGAWSSKNFEILNSNIHYIINSFNFCAGLFKRTILQSGSAMAFWATTLANSSSNVKLSEAIANAVGCPLSGANPKQCLQAIVYGRLLNESLV